MFKGIVWNISLPFFVFFFPSLFHFYVPFLSSWPLNTNFLSIYCLFFPSCHWSLNTNFLPFNCLFFPSFHTETNFLSINCLIVTFLSFKPLNTNCLPLDFPFFHWILISCPLPVFFLSFLSSYTNFLLINCLFLPFLFPHCWILISCQSTVLFFNSCSPDRLNTNCLPFKCFSLFPPSLQRSPFLDSRYVPSKGVNMKVTPP